MGSSMNILWERLAVALRAELLVASRNLFAGILTVRRMDFLPASGECDDARESVTGGDGDDDEEDGTTRVILLDLSLVLASGGLDSLLTTARDRSERRGDIVWYRRCQGRQ